MPFYDIITNLFENPNSQSSALNFTNETNSKEETLLQESVKQFQAFKQDSLRHAEYLNGTPTPNKTDAANPVVSLFAGVSNTMVNRINPLNTTNQNELIKNQSAGNVITENNSPFPAPIQVNKSNPDTLLGKIVKISNSSASKRKPNSQIPANPTAKQTAATTPPHVTKPTATKTQNDTKEKPTTQIKSPDEATETNKRECMIKRVSGNGYVPSESDHELLKKILAIPEETRYTSEEYNTFLDKMGRYRWYLKTIERSLIQTCDDKKNQLSDSTDEPKILVKRSAENGDSLPESNSNDPNKPHTRVKREPVTKKMRTDGKQNTLNVEDINNTFIVSCDELEGRGQERNEANYVCPTTSQAPQQDTNSGSEDLDFEFLDKVIRYDNENLGLDFEFLKQAINNDAASSVGGGSGSNPDPASPLFLNLVQDEIQNQQRASTLNNFPNGIDLAVAPPTHNDVRRVANIRPFDEIWPQRVAEGVAEGSIPASMARRILEIGNLLNAEARRILEIALNDGLRIGYFYNNNVSNINIKTDPVNLSADDKTKYKILRQKTRDNFQLFGLYHHRTDMFALSPSCFENIQPNFQTQHWSGLIEHLLLRRSIAQRVYETHPGAYRPFSPEELHNFFHSGIENVNRLIRLLNNFIRMNRTKERQNKSRRLEDYIKENDSFWLHDRTSNSAYFRAVLSRTMTRGAHIGMSENIFNDLFALVFLQRFSGDFDQMKDIYHRYYLNHAKVMMDLDSNPELQRVLTIPNTPQNYNDNTFIIIAEMFGIINHMFGNVGSNATGRGSWYESSSAASQSHYERNAANIGNIIDEAERIANPDGIVTGLGNYIAKGLVEFRSVIEILGVGQQLSFSIGSANQLVNPNPTTTQENRQNKMGELFHQAQATESAFGHRFASNSQTGIYSNDYIDTILSNEGSLPGTSNTVAANLNITFGDNSGFTNPNRTVVNIMTSESSAEILNECAHASQSAAPTRSVTTQKPSNGAESQHRERRSIVNSDKSSYCDTEGAKEVLARRQNAINQKFYIDEIRLFRQTNVANPFQRYVKPGFEDEYVMKEMGKYIQALERMAADIKSLDKNTTPYLTRNIRNIDTLLRDMHTFLFPKVYIKIVEKIRDRRLKSNANPFYTRPQTLKSIILPEIEREIVRAKKYVSVWLLYEIPEWVELSDKKMYDKLKLNYQTRMDSLQSRFGGTDLPSQHFQAEYLARIILETGFAPNFPIERRIPIYQYLANNPKRRKEIIELIKNSPKDVYVLGYSTEREIIISKIVGLPTPARMERVLYDIVNEGDKTAAAKYLNITDTELDFRVDGRKKTVKMNAPPEAVLFSGYNKLFNEFPRSIDEESRHYTLLDLNSNSFKELSKAVEDDEARIRYYKGGLKVLPPLSENEEYCGRHYVARMRKDPNIKVNSRVINCYPAGSYKVGDAWFASTKSDENSDQKATCINLVQNPDFAKNAKVNYETSEHGKGDEIDTFINCLGDPDETQKLNIEFGTIFIRKNVGRIVEFNNDGKKKKPLKVTEWVERS